MKFSPANAREMAARSAEARRNRHANEQIATASIALISAQPEVQAVSLYAQELMRAQVELLQELRTTRDARDKAALSQAIKNLKESYHMETGKPKPGTIKPERQSSRQQVRQPSEPKLDTPTGSVPES